MKVKENKKSAEFEIKNKKRKEKLHYSKECLENIISISVTHVDEFLLEYFNKQFLQLLLTLIVLLKIKD